ncbi:helix-turn-helix domain-containing protein [Streptomyces flavofungini]|uniref:helix-turn-helix domain-containing protein n=1 Tax=Streptomyces flavofungini TaxID=68200 RepID=UPI0034DEE2ED
MTADYQQAREALGVRLKQLRINAPGGRLTGEQLAKRAGWAQSKISRLERGQQTATAEDLESFAKGCGQPEAADELKEMLRGVESRVRPWRRQLAGGHRAVQNAHNVEHENASLFRGWEPAMIMGILQTPDYAKAIFTRYSELQRSPRDADAAVRARIKRQDALYNPAKRFHLLMWEGALRTLICPPSVLISQLDRLHGAVGMDTVELGIIPHSASLKIPPATGFWVYDDQRVVVETWHAELWIDDTPSVQTYLRTWNTLRESAVYGADAHHLINAARRALTAR